MDNVSQYYSSSIASLNEQIDKLKKKLLAISFARFFFFVFALVSPFFIYPLSHVAGILIPLFSLVVFLFFVKRNVAVAEKKQYLENKRLICKNELEGISHNFSVFDGGSEFIDPLHFNSYDLDVFGKGSLFQYINRTVTFRGKSVLAGMFTHSITQNDALRRRQQLVAELSTDTEWRHDFAALGMMYAEDKEESEMFGRWAKETFSFSMSKVIPVLLVVMPLLAIFSLIYWIVFSNSALFLFSILLQSILWMVERRNTTLIYARFGRRVKILSKYATLLSRIEQRNWKSDEAISILASMETRGIPSKEISQLKQLVSAYDNRNNFLLGFMLNVVFMWDILCSYRLANWHIRNKENYTLWDSTIGFFDAIASLSTLAYNHPGYCYPVFSTGKFMVEANQLGHPLIKPDKMIANNFAMKGEKQLVIVTGANMAGKSTFLRTIGVNLVLAMTGAPVCAQRMEFVPVEVFSNMRTTDSLFDEESYFFAELKRIKMILDALSSGRKVLIILDEILKGTNSVDKLAGSQKLVDKLVKMNASAIIATHDLKLTEMEHVYPQFIQNNCFEIIIENDEMQFDYTLREGVTQTMNATFLMKKMGII